MPTLTRNPMIDEYVAECFALEYEEQPEPRDWHKLPETAAIPKLAVGPLPKQAMQQIEAALKKYPDFDFLYLWQGYIYHRRWADCENAARVYQRGLFLSRSKLALLDALGTLAYEQGNLGAAVQWWVRACHLQVVSGEFSQPHTFMMLAYLARDAGLQAEARTLFQKMDRIEHERLDWEGHARLLAQYRRLGSQGQKSLQKSIKAAIQRLCREIC